MFGDRLVYAAGAEIRDAKDGSRVAATGEGEIASFAVVGDAIAVSTRSGKVTKIHRDGSETLVHANTVGGLGGVDSSNAAVFAAKDGDLTQIFQMGRGYVSVSYNLFDFVPTRFIGMVPVSGTGEFLVKGNVYGTGESKLYPGADVEKYFLYATPRAPGDRISSIKRLNTKTQFVRTLALTSETVRVVGYSINQGAYWLTSTDEGPSTLHTTGLISLDWVP